MGAYVATGTLWLSMPAAMALDLLLGDPQAWPHPVRWMGRSIEWLEPVCRRLWGKEVRAGRIFAATLLVTVWVVSFVTFESLYRLNPVVGFITETMALYYCLSIRSLMLAAMEIHGLLTDTDRQIQIDLARRKLSRIVSRDVDHYQSDDVARATVETVAENFVDGVLAPLFFAVLGGAPLALAYKMVNTMDSMVGYKNAHYRFFGRCAARMDDMANYIPARLAVPLIALAAQFPPGRITGRVFITAMREGRHHASPNAGYPEAAFCGALAVRLKGTDRYHGRWVSAPYLGIAFGPVKPNHIVQACRLMGRSSILSGAVLWLLHLMFQILL